MEPGKYIARATNFSFGESKNKGTPFVSVTFQVDKDTITWYGYFTEKTKERTVEALMNAGWDGKNPETLDGLGSVDCQIVVIDEPDNMDPTKIYKRVQYVNKLRAAAPPKALDPSKKKLLFANMRRAAAELEVKRSESEGDNLPF